MKNRLEKVYSKLPTVELTTQKIELGITDDFEQLSNNANSNIDKAYSEVKKSSSKINGFINDAISNISKADKMFKDIDSKVKDLGLKMPSNLTTINKENQISLKELFKLRKATASLTSTI